MTEEIYRVADLIMHYAESQTRELGERESFACTAEELEHEVRRIVQKLKAEHPDAAPSIWSEIDSTTEGAIADAFAQTFRCWPTKEGRIVYIDNPPGLPPQDYNIAKSSVRASEVLKSLHLEVTPPESDLDN